MLQDVEAGRAPEIDALVGAVVELARLTETPTPHIDSVYALVKLLAPRRCRRQSQGHVQAAGDAGGREIATVAYIDERVAAGEYANRSDCVRDLVRKHQREHVKQRLRTLIEDGLASGPATPVTQSDWDELRALAKGDTE